MNANEYGLSRESYVQSIIGGELVSDLTNQLGDIDLIHPNFGKVSVKSMDKCLETGNLSFETHLINPSNREEVKSWWYTSKADYMAISIGDRVIVMDCEALHTFVDENMESYRTTLLTDPKLIAENELRNGKYKQARCVLVPLYDIERYHLIEHSFES